jgi:malate dehydrogenase (oxaloacetate-decarboxylating)
MVTKLKFPWRYSDPLPVRKRGYALVRDPLLNKSSAFPEKERVPLGLCGMLPTSISTIEEQAERIYPNITRIADPLDKYVGLAALQDRNETLFFHLLCEHMEEFLPVVYTPTVGLASRNFSHVFRRGRGLWITPDMRGRIKGVLESAINERMVSLIVVTDNESILGIGDQGAGGMAISVGKLSLYTACAGIHPGSVLPISLDVGTDNQELLDDELYVGWRQKRLRGAAYDELIEEFVAATRAAFPGVLIQWEDFRKENALHILERYREQVPSFNDDIQGTGAVALAGLYSACRVTGETLAQQRIVILGAGAAGLGIARQIRAGLRLDGVPDTEILGRIAVLDSRGLLVDDREFGDTYKHELAWPAALAEKAGFAAGEPHHLEAVVRAFRPTVLIGTSGQAGAFSETAIKTMAAAVSRPVVMPFSNPTDYSEAIPEDVINWSEGRALVATGSPFAPVSYAGRNFEIGQGNNVFIFPGLGLGALLSEASSITDAMISVAARALAGTVTEAELARGLLYPSVARLRAVSAEIAAAVMQQAEADGVCSPLADDLPAQVSEAMWEPRYTDYQAID